MVKRALVAIGVDHIDGLEILSAAKGAQSIVEWAEEQRAAGQDFDITLLTDEAGHKVTLRDIKDAVGRYVSRGIYHQLIIYFAGHGFMKGPEQELWLLSNAPGDANEAVNVRGSIDASRNSKIEHVVFISDACRSQPPDSLFSAVQGGVIFPNEKPAPKRPEVDSFYASLLGEAANEVPHHESSNNNRGLFTESFLKGLTGRESRVISLLPDASPRQYVVPAHLLKAFVEEDLPKSASQVSIRLRQYPDIRVESHLPKYLSFISNPPVPRIPTRPAGEQLQAAGADAILSSIATRHKLNEFLAYPRGPVNVFEDVDVRFDRAFEDAKAQDDTLDTNRLQIGTGFSVLGAKIQNAFVSAGSVRLVPESTRGGLEHVSVQPDEDGRYPKSLLIAFESSGTCLGVLQDFIATVVVDEGRVVGVNYTPRRGTQRWIEYQYVHEEVDRRRAFVAAAARLGLFRVTGPGASSLAEYLRAMKYFDPTLGLYAAYAYARAGLTDQVLSVYEFMRQDNVPVLFDVAMLSGSLEEGIDAPQPAPFCPMLSEGWALLGTHGPKASILQILAGHLVPALWTTFRPAGVDLIADHLENGEIQ